MIHARLRDQLMEHGLAKLRITAYKRPSNELEPIGSLSAMYNPKTINLSYEAQYEAGSLIGEPETRNRYVKSHPGGLHLDLIFDATLPGNSDSVEAQLKELRRLTMSVYEVSPTASSGGVTAQGGDSDAYKSSHMSTPHLRVSWGTMQWHEHGYFAGFLSKLSITYTLFDRDGTPLRATAALDLVASTNLTIEDAGLSKFTPPVASVSVPDMSALDLVAGAFELVSAGFVGWSYLQLAYDNALNNFDDFQPGDILNALGV